MVNGFSGFFNIIFIVVFSKMNNCSDFRDSEIIMYVRKCILLESTDPLKKNLPVDTLRVVKISI